MNHPKIEHNGKMVHTTDSLGRRIHHTDEGVKSFHDWFGDDDNVDEHGRPKVLFHSSLADTKEFSSVGKFMGHTGTSGISLTDSPEMASRYLDRYDTHGWVDGVANQPFSKNVLPVYAKLGKTLHRDEPFPLPPGKGLGSPLEKGYVPIHKKMGFDTLVRNDSISKGGAVKHSSAKNAIRGKEYVLTSPTQIKSAMGNSGKFSAASANLHEDFTIPNQDKTLGMQRRSLPQIDTKALIKDKDFLVTGRDMSTKDLIPTQKHFNDDKVNGMIDAFNGGKMAGKKFDGVIISKDNYIIDGHHRALAAHNTCGEVSCLQIDDNIDEALDKLDGKDYVMKKKLMESKTIKSFKEFVAEAIAGKDSRQTEINFEPTIADTLTQGTDASINPDRVMSEPGKKPDGGKWMDAKESQHHKHRDPNELGVKNQTEVDQALNTDARSVEVMGRGHNIDHGQLVGARLNLNVLKNTKVPVLTLHKATNKEGYKVGKGFYKGTPLQYHHVVTLKNAHFNVDQTGREQIATGQQSKFPMASVDGEFQKVAAHSFDGVEARFNPMQHHLFVDPEGRAIRSAEEVTLHGHRAYLRGKIEYHTAKTAPKRKGDHPSLAQLMEGRKEILMTPTSQQSEYEIYFG